MFAFLRSPFEAAIIRSAISPEIASENPRTRKVRLILQRVASAAVSVDGEVVGAIGRGLLVLAGAEKGDTPEVAAAAAAKVSALRMFADSEGKTNLSCAEAGGAALVVSQFTLLADTSRGRRPSFLDAAPPEVAEPLVEALAAALEQGGLRVGRGRFGAAMRIEAVLDGPFTLHLTFAAGGSCG
jgi:D-aminoacyl-tRNA deacylase